MDLTLICLCHKADELEGLCQPLPTIFHLGEKRNDQQPTWTKSIRDVKTEYVVDEKQLNRRVKSVRTLFQGSGKDPNEHERWWPVSRYVTLLKSSFTHQLRNLSSGKTSMLTLRTIVVQER